MLRRTAARFAVIVAIMTGLLLSSGIASATNFEVGLNECGNGECTGNTSRQLTIYKPVSLPAGPFDPHFTP